MSAIQIAKTTMICGAVADSVAVGAVDEAVGKLHRRGEEGISVEGEGVGVEGEGVGVEGEGVKKMAAPMQPDDGNFPCQVFLSGKNDFHMSEEQKKRIHLFLLIFVWKVTKKLTYTKILKHTRKVSKI